MPGSRAERNSPITVGTVTVEPGQRRSLELPIARLSTGTSLNLSVEVTNGALPGPRMRVSGEVHGDELNGIEFPGSPRGSLGARLANLFLRTVVPTAMWASTCTPPAGRG